MEKCTRKFFKARCLKEKQKKRLDQQCVFRLYGDMMGRSQGFAISQAERFSAVFTCTY